MSDQQKNRFAAGIALQAEMIEALQVQVRALLQEQADLLDATQKTMLASTKRRQEALEASLRQFQAMGACKDPAGMIAAYNEWVKNSMSRVFTEMHCARADAARLAEIGQKSISALMAGRAETSALIAKVTHPEKEEPLLSWEALELPKAAE